MDMITIVNKEIVEVAPILEVFISKDSGKIIYKHEITSFSYIRIQYSRLLSYLSKWSYYE